MVPNMPRRTSMTSASGPAFATSAVDGADSWATALLGRCWPAARSSAFV